MMRRRKKMKKKWMEATRKAEQTSPVKGQEGKVDSSVRNKRRRVI
jgi:hypothetical protein